MNPRMVGQPLFLTRCSETGVIKQMQPKKLRMKFPMNTNKPATRDYPAAGPSTPDYTLPARSYSDTTAPSRLPSAFCGEYSSLNLVKFKVKESVGTELSPELPAD